MLLLSVCACLELEAAPQSALVSTPSAQIDLSPLGYRGLSAAARELSDANVSLDMLAADRVLLTFNPKKLFNRLPDCPPSHKDRLVHAVVLEVPGGRVLKEADWYLHDSRRYLWPLGSGRVLLRRLNTLYEVDSNLQEKTVFDPHKELLWVTVTPDGKQIIAETSEEATPAHDPKSKALVKISFLDADTLAVQRVIESRGAINLQATASGFADVRNAGNVWLVRFGPTVKERVNIARLRARRSPNILYSSANTLLIGRCSLVGDTYSVSAFTVAGTLLWRQHWNGCRYAPIVRTSEDGSRFAVSTATIRSEPSSEAGPSDADSEEEHLEQTVQVLDTASGNAVLTVQVEPPVLDGQNISLSPDGSQFALLHDTSIHVYSLRQMSGDERTRYLAVKSDAPNLFVPLRTGKSAEEETIYISAANEEASAEDPNPASSSTAATTIAPKLAPPTASETSATAAAPAATPQGGANAAPPAITIRTSTQVVALDVVVTDSKGHPVKGLQQSDFTVAEDGKTQSVRFFREYAGAQPAAPSRQVTETLPPNVFSNQAQPAEPGAVTVVLLDLLNTSMADQSHAQAELVKFLKNKPKGSEFALCTLGDRLQMIQGFTQDGSILLAAAHSKKAAMRHRSLLDSNTAQPIVEAGTATAQSIPSLDFFVQSIELQESETRVLDADRRMYITVDAFAQLARYLSGIPGRKNLVWLSGSFTLGISPDTTGQSPFIQARNYSDNLKKVSNLLAEAHVAVYPVDVQGLVTDPLFTATSNDTLSPLSMQGTTPTGPAGSGSSSGGRRIADTTVPITVMQNQAEQFALTRMGERATMKQIAADTGGQAFYNTNDIAQAVNTAAEQGSNYYALSYTPANKRYDGGFRKVKVAVAGPKYHLAYRTGYYAVDPYAPVKPTRNLASSLAMAAMQQGSPQSRQIVFAAKVVPLGKPKLVKDTAPQKPSRKRKETGPVEMQRYAVDYAVTTTDLRFSATPEGTYHDVLHFMITAFDEDGHLGASQISQLDADLKPEVFRDIALGGIRLHEEIEVPVKSVAMRLGVEDVANSHIGTIEIPLPVKASPDAPAVARRSLPAIEPD
ncbi:MAG: VWA domain-containing protein [Terriglobales bacterium]